MNPLYAVLWDDAHFQMDEVWHQPIRICTVGFLIKRDRTGVMLAHEYCGDGDYRGFTFVPRDMVVRVVKLE